MADDTTNTAPDFLELATGLTIAWLSNPNTRASADEVPNFLQTMHGAVKDLVAPAAPVENQSEAATEYTPAVSVRRSLASKEHLISLIDGKPYKTLKRHLSTHGLTPQQYRQRYNLKSDYPMVAETYAEMRRGLAKKIGLGRKPGEKVAPKSAAKPAAAKPSVAKSAQKPAAVSSEGQPATAPKAKSARRPRKAAAEG